MARRSWGDKKRKPKKDRRWKKVFFQWKRINAANQGGRTGKQRVTEDKERLEILNHSRLRISVEQVPHRCWPGASAPFTRWRRYIKDARNPTHVKLVPPPLYCWCGNIKAQSKSAVDTQQHIGLMYYSKLNISIYFYLLCYSTTFRLPHIDYITLLKFRPSLATISCNILEIWHNYGQSCLISVLNSVSPAAPAYVWVSIIYTSLLLLLSLWACTESRAD